MAKMVRTPVRLSSGISVLRPDRTTTAVRPCSRPRHSLAECASSGAPTFRALAVLTGQQPARLLAAVKGERPEGLFVVALSAGLRRGELLGLRWKDVDLDRGQFAVTGSLQGTTRPTLVIGSPKSGGSGAVALGPAGCVCPP